MLDYHRGVSGDAKNWQSSDFSRVQHQAGIKKWEAREALKERGKNLARRGRWKGFLGRLVNIRD